MYVNRATRQPQYVSGKTVKLNFIRKSEALGKRGYYMSIRFLTINAKNIIQKGINSSD